MTMIDPTEEQRRLIEFVPEQNLLIRGEAGSGKTTILALRGAYVSQKSPGSMLFLTYNSALETHLKQLAEQGDLPSVTITTFHSWVYKFAKTCGAEPPEFASDSDRKELLTQALNGNADRWGSHRLYASNEGFWKDELRFVFGQGLGSRRRYLEAPRSGMGTAVRVTQEDKEMIYDVVSSYRNELRARNLYDGDDPAGVVSATVKASGGLFPEKARYDHVFIDEVQDFDSSWLSAVAPVARKSMSLAGDLAQRIYPRSFTWQGVGIPIPPARSKRLEGSHRTTREIMQVAVFLADNEDLQSNEDYQAPTLSTRSGPRVIRIQRTKFWEAEEALVKHVESLRQRHPHDTIVIAAPFSKTAEKLANDLTAAGVEARHCKGRDLDTQASDVLTTNFHQLKGLEFDHVVLASMGDDSVPGHGLKIEDSQTAEEKQNYIQRLVYVAMTRARSTVTLVGAKPFCRFFKKVPGQLFEEL
jgi:superfamily I DNA/RNA helicase